MVEAKIFSFKKAKISYTDEGIGDAIVFLHGFLENKSMWEPFLFDLSKKNHVICIDLLGHGKSECLGYVHTMELQAEMIFTLLESLKISKAHFVGHSMGGYVALAFAELYPDTIYNLVLLNSTSYEDSPEKKANRDRAILAVKQNYKAAVGMSIANLFSIKNQTKMLNEIDQVKKEALKTPLQGIIAAQEGMKIRKDRLFILKKMEVSKTLILGKEDPVLDYKMTSQQIKGTTAKLITYPDGHMSTIENKEELLQYFIFAFG
jgi:pimeloyl-ACP methyl ester carboxylesterase